MCSGTDACDATTSSKFRFPCVRTSYVSGSGSITAPGSLSIRKVCQISKDKIRQAYRHPRGTEKGDDHASPRSRLEKG